ncbi:nucleoside monophosphate kinase [Candidatus Dojkabacteria bacterium]|uniref:Adenylate kinase n=1 Tax=Candidatus Dojkabacteria bacterium TaxID=2099670 RepID=A0A955I1M7_9BACT|nr:nucleoside monophosphate kinase [Candidatus Dojkabacteria bacterium]MCB9790790.1 nucleoside monophosphate kinase [Candidatus Nomurabacteria bacterium]
MNTLHFHGPSGSGKDTQLDLLEKLVDFERIGTGDMFRRMFEQGTELGKKANEYWGKGNLVPTELTYQLLEEWCKQFDPAKPWYFVSTVRAVDQISRFDDLLAKFDRKLDHFIHFALSEEAAIDRLSLRWYCPKDGTTYHEKYKKEKIKGICDKDGTQLIQRSDDKPDAIKQRMSFYRESIEPILSEYRSRGILIEIDAAPSIEEIHHEVVKVLGL